jgi:hypothetical protein
MDYRVQRREVAWCDAVQLHGRVARAVEFVNGMSGAARHVDYVTPDETSRAGDADPHALTLAK